MSKLHFSLHGSLIFNVFILFKFVNVFQTNGTQVHLDGFHGIGILSDVIEPSVWTINAGRYQPDKADLGVHGNGHLLVASSPSGGVGCPKSQFRPDVLDYPLSSEHLSANMQALGV